MNRWLEKRNGGEHKRIAKVIRIKKTIIRKKVAKNECGSSGKKKGTGGTVGVSELTTTVMASEPISTTIAQSTEQSIAFTSPSMTPMESVTSPAVGSTESEPAVEPDTPPVMPADLSDVAQEMDDACIYFELRFKFFVESFLFFSL